MIADAAPPFARHHFILFYPITPSPFGPPASSSSYVFSDLENHALRLLEIPDPCPTIRAPLRTPAEAIATAAAADTRNREATTTTGADAAHLCGGVGGSQVRLSRARSEGDLFRMRGANVSASLGLF